jgi:hypothetical protein
VKQARHLIAPTKYAQKLTPLTALPRWCSTICTVASCSKWAVAKFYTTKTPITAADLLNDRVPPFFAEQGIGIIRILTGHSTEYSGKQERMTTSSIWP